MKLIALIALFAVGVASEAEEVTSATPSPPLTTIDTTSYTTLTATTTQTEGTNRRDGVSYSSSIIHRDPNYPEKDAKSSINFHINNEDKTTSHQVTTPKYQEYQYQGDFSSHSASADEAEPVHNKQEQSDVIYGKNAVSGPPPSYHSHQEQETYSRPESQSQTDHRHEHHNHQPYYKPIAYAQPTFTDTKHKTEVQHPTGQYKYTSTIHKTLSTSRPKAIPNVRGPVRYHSSPSSSHGHQHSQHSHHTQQAQHSHNTPLTTSHSHPAPSKLIPQAQPYTQVIFKPESPKTGKSISSISQSNSNHGQSQSFNVGYSVKFGNDPNAPKKTFKAIHTDSDIITGSHKEEVRKPINMHNYNLSPSNSHQVLSEANLTPKTQKQLAFLENIQSQKYIQKEPIQSNFPWKNLSPSVEIYRSKEISLPGTPKNSYGFDHDKAIGKSEGFDYSNAVEYMQKLQAQAASQTQPLGYLPDEETKIHLQQQPEAQMTYIQVSEAGQPLNTQIPPVPKLPIDTSLLREPFLTVHKERINPQDPQIPIHFDTSLIKEMSNGYGNIYADNYPSHIQTHTESNHRTNFQDSLTQINNLLAEQSQHNSRYQQLPSSDSQEQDPGIFLLRHEQVHAHQQQQLENKDLEMSFSYPQNGLFNPNLQNHLQGLQKPIETSQAYLYSPNTGAKAIDPQLLKQMKMYKVKEHVRDHIPPQQSKFKVFGKPGNAFMRHQYEKLRNDRPVRVQSGPSSNSKRYVRDYTNIEMDLRPPPMTMPFKTSNLFRIKQ